MNDETPAKCSRSGSLSPAVDGDSETKAVDKIHEGWCPVEVAYDHNKRVMACLARCFPPMARDASMQQGHDEMKRRVAQIDDAIAQSEASVADEGTKW